MAFQIVDDILDLTGTEDGAGKTLGTDLKQEKMTLPLIHYLSQALPAERQWVRDFLKGKTDEPIGVLTERLEQAGSLAYAREKAQEYARKAQEALPALPDVQAGEVLQELAQLVAA